MTTSLIASTVCMIAGILSRKVRVPPCLSHKDASTCCSCYVVTGPCRDDLLPAGTYTCKYWSCCRGTVSWRKIRVALQDELYLKNPAVIASIRGWSLLAEGYRLNVALSLHAIQMVSAPALHS